MLHLLEIANSDTGNRMTDTTYLLKLKAPQPSVHLFVASTLEVHGDQVVLLNGRGNLVAMIVLEIIESWCEVDIQSLATRARWKPPQQLVKRSKEVNAPRER